MAFCLNMSNNNESGFFPTFGQEAIAMQERITIHELTAKVLAGFKQAGFSDTTIWRTYMPLIGVIENYFRKTDHIYYDPAVTEEFIQLQQERYKRGELSSSYRMYRSAARRMNEVYMTGKISVPSMVNPSRYVLNEEHGRLLDSFLHWKQYGSNTRDDALWAVRKYLCFLETKGLSFISDASVDDARTFLLQTASEVKLSTLHTLLLYLRHFHIFLKETGVPAPDCVELFSYKVYREMPIQSYVTDEELDAILGVIDTNTPKGKRNLAIILLAASTGMRACDIIRLKLSDIDWRKGEIRIVQRKTKRTVVLPLIPEAGAALKDYILHARPDADCPELFLRYQPPHVAIMDATTIGDMFQNYQKKAGIVRQPFDGKGFHGLRRRLAKKLIVTGTPLTTVAQILGHNDLRSSRQYLSLDTGNLKECALDFSDIPMVRRKKK